MFRFEKLDVWHDAIALSSRVYTATRSFPKEELYGLQSQLRRAAVSVSANIAEGSGRSTDREFVRFIEIAFGSLMETVSHLTIALRQAFIKQAEYDSLYADCEKLGKMLSGLRNHLQKPNA
jgi:four helix bundle protein